MQLACPIPIQDYPRVLLAHGGGGTLMRGLISRMFAAAFTELGLQFESDAALLEPTDWQEGSRLAMTTDSFVVQPLFFPGGDIGSLAVHGTVNDLATSGARCRWMSVGFILEEGLPMEDLWRVVCSMRDAAQACGASIVTGDTKVVQRGKADLLFVNTTGVGIVQPGVDLVPSRIQDGDAILVNGDIGRHGMAVMAVREGLEFETQIESDSAPIADLVMSLMESGIDVKCVRDATRGGLASVLHELSGPSGCGFELDESAIPVREDVRGACEVLGLDPLYVACEGRFVTFVPADQAALAIQTLRQHPVGQGACPIGVVRRNLGVPVAVRSVAGTRRIVPMLSGEQLPRIC